MLTYLILLLYYSSIVSNDKSIATVRGPLLQPEVHSKWSCCIFSYRSTRSRHLEISFHSRQVYIPKMLLERDTNKDIYKDIHAWKSKPFATTSNKAIRQHQTRI